MSQERKFYQLSVDERVDALRNASRWPETLSALGTPDPLPLTVADQLIENVIGVFPLPLGLVRGLVVNGATYDVPMAVEEPSVVAAANHGAKLIAACGGVHATADAPRMVGQILLAGVPVFEAAAQRLAAARDALLVKANAVFPRLQARGGGARAFEVRALDAQPDGWLVAFELEVDVRDAMGANVVTAMCEALAAEVAACAQGRVCMSIVTNLCDRRLAQARVRLEPGLLTADGLANIALASRFAECCPYRAATHNKGIMNGIDGFLVALGQDWRAAEAAAHAYAGMGDGYRPLTRWWLEDGALLGEIVLPMAIGTVGQRAQAHPSVVAARALCGGGEARELAMLAAALGLAQNLAALRALTQEGIQQGHMALHRRIAELEDGSV